MADVVKTVNDEVDLDEVLDELANDHGQVSMRGARLDIEGTGITLWATRGFQLSRGRYRITWRYEQRGAEDVIVCFTLAEIS